MKTFIQQLLSIIKCICNFDLNCKLIESVRKDIYNVTKDYISNKCYSFEFSINQRILKQKKCTQLFST